jgi:hypothetical protein
MGKDFDYEEKLKEFLTKNSLDEETKIAEVNICFSLVEIVKVKNEKLNK